MNRFRISASKDFIGGLLIMVIGAATALQASRYDIGSLRAMGPGFFPLALGVILVLTGALMLLATSRPAAGGEGEKRAPEWRGWLCICAGIAAFAVLGIYGGLVPATFAVVFISALGDRTNTITAAGVLAAAMTLTCVVVFWWLLQLQIPLFRWG